MGLAVAAELPGRVDRCLGRRPTPSHSIILPSILAHMAARAASESLSAARSGMSGSCTGSPSRMRVAELSETS